MTHHPTDTERAERDEAMRAFSEEWQCIGQWTADQMEPDLLRIYDLGRKHGALEMRERTAKAADGCFEVEYAADRSRALDGELREIEERHEQDAEEQPSEVNIAHACPASRDRATLLDAVRRLTEALQAEKNQRACWESTAKSDHAELLDAQAEIADLRAQVERAEWCLASARFTFDHFLAIGETPEHWDLYDHAAPEGEEYLGRYVSLDGAYTVARNRIAEESK